MRLRLGLGNVDTFVQASDIACDAATLHIETDLRTPLLQADYVDYYFVQAADRGLVQLMLKLSAGFVAPTTFHIGTGMTRALALVDTSLEEDALLSAELGTVTLTDAMSKLNRWVAVRYTAGLPAAASPNTDEMFDVSNAPEWLLQAAEVKAISLIGDSPELDNKDGKMVESRSFARQYTNIIERKVRYTPDARLPVS